MTMEAVSRPHQPAQGDIATLQQLPKRKRSPIVRVALACTVALSVAIVGFWAAQGALQVCLEFCAYLALGIWQLSGH